MHSGAYRPPAPDWDELADTTTPGDPAAERALRESAGLPGGPGNLTPPPAGPDVHDLAEGLGLA